MRAPSVVAVCSFLAVWLLGIPSPAQPQDRGPGASKPALYNTAKQKLLEGKQVFSFTQTKFDIAGYCEAAKHFDYAWFEMQHSTLEFKDVEAMIAACPHAGATPMIRLPDAQEWHIQHATDIGALGVIVPTVDDVDRAREAAKWARYPPVARRSAGSGQAARIWGINGINYRQTINDNMLVVIMIETPLGVANAKEIAAVPGVDVIFAASTDLGNFSGTKQGEPRYESMVTTIHDTVLKAGIKLGGPLAWKDRAGFTFFQGPGETALIRAGAPVTLGTPTKPAGARRGVAPLEGTGPQ
jgi:2-keto-3-deoxy-L-rhamnonate aldolase RhmA